MTVADPGGAPLAHAPIQVQILSFWHTNFSKRSHLGSWRPPYEVGAPPTGNPGSATAWLHHKPKHMCYALIFHSFLAFVAVLCGKQKCTCSHRTLKDACEVHAHAFNKRKPFTCKLCGSMLSTVRCTLKVLHAKTFHRKSQWWLMTVSSNSAIISLHRIPQVWPHFTWKTTSGGQGFFSLSIPHMFYLNIHGGNEEYLSD